MIKNGWIINMPAFLLKYKQSAEMQNVFLYQNFVYLNVSWKSWLLQIIYLCIIKTFCQFY